MERAGSEAVRSRGASRSMYVTYLPTVLVGLEPRERAALNIVFSLLNPVADAHGWPRVHDIY